MPSQKLLWFVNSIDVTDQGEWRGGLANFSITMATSLLEARNAIAPGELDCMVVAGTGPEADPFQLMEMVHKLDPLLPIVFWDPAMRATEAVRLIRAGAYSCIGYRDSLHALRECLENAIDERRRHEKLRNKSVAGELWRTFLVGESRPMNKVAHTIRLIGPRRCTVLITGETGTGKEIVARALHMAGPRANQQFVAINCSALPEHLLEAELFGHVKGAFTGALNTRIGRFEQAHKGTLFLDEIGDMPIALQAKLLRVLQEREIQRLGSSETIKLDVRVIAASNLDLPERIRQGLFREDLYYRLNVVPLHILPLRQRDADIPLLVHHFVKKICQIEGIPVKHVPPETLDGLRSANWPGNVRQLENAVEMAVAMSGERDTLELKDFGITSANCAHIIPIESAASTVPAAEPMDFEMAMSRYERSMLEGALQKTSGNRTAAAQLLGIKRTTLVMKLRNFENSSTFRVG